MDLQQIASLSIVALASTLLVRLALGKSGRPMKRPCGGSCACASGRVAPGHPAVLKGK